MDYEQDTRRAYQSSSQAGNYQRQFTGITWARLTMWRERRLVKKALQQCQLQPGDNVLDVPCGTGILGPIFRHCPVRVLAADISLEMMRLARHAYQNETFRGFVQADITQAPFPKGAFSCVITLGLMHRLSKEIRGQVLRELGRLSSRFVILSYSLDSPWQQVKKFLAEKVWRSYSSAPAPARFSDVANELAAHDFVIRKKFNPVPFFSSEVVLLAEKKS